MQNKLIILGILTSISVSTALAATNAQPAKAATTEQAAQVMLYQAPQANAAMVEKVNPSERLVGIFQQGDWIKVGDPHNGQTGWINREQYQQAVNKYFQSSIHTVYIQTASNDKGQSNIVAYENGKKLSDKEAKELYERIQKQQTEQARYMQQMFWNMHNVLDQEMHQMNEFNPWNELNIGLMPQPIIVINQAPQK